MPIFESHTVTATSTAVTALDDFLGLVEIPSFKRKLRNLLLYYLIHESEELPSEAGSFIEDMKFFFDFLDVAEDETKTK